MPKTTTNPQRDLREFRNFPDSLVSATTSVRSTIPAEVVKRYATDPYLLLTLSNIAPRMVVTCNCADCRTPTRMPALHCSTIRGEKMTRAMRIICVTAMIRLQQILGHKADSSATQASLEQWKGVVLLRQQQITLGEYLIRQISTESKNFHVIYQKHTCAFCLISIPETLRACSRCYRAHYCSIVCQRLDYAVHRPTCFATEKNPKPRLPGRRESSLEWQHLQSNV